METTTTMSDNKVLSTVKTLFALRESTLFLMILVFGIAMNFASPVFLNRLNLEAILLGLTVEAPIAVGMVILLISGGLDLSVGSTLAFTGIITGIALRAE